MFLPRYLFAYLCFLDRRSYLVRRVGNSNPSDLVLGARYLPCIALGIPRKRAPTVSRYCSPSAVKLPRRGRDLGILHGLIPGRAGHVSPRDRPVLALGDQIPSQERFRGLNPFATKLHVDRPAARARESEDTHAPTLNHMRHTSLCCPDLRVTRRAIHAGVGSTAPCRNHPHAHSPVNRPE